MEAGCMLRPGGGVRGEASGQRRWRWRPAEAGKRKVAACVCRAAGTAGVYARAGALSARPGGRNSRLVGAALPILLS